MAEDIIRVLYLDDEEPNLFSFKAAFRREFEVHTCDEPHKAVRLLDAHEFHVILSDQRMPRISGVEFFELIMPDHPDISRILVTGYADTDAVVDAINKGQVYRFVSKPWNEEELRGVIRAGYDLNRSRVRSAARGTEVLATLDELGREVDRISNSLAEGGADLGDRVAADLEAMKRKIEEEHARYSRSFERSSR